MQFSLGNIQVIDKKGTRYPRSIDGDQGEQMFGERTLESEREWKVCVREHVRRKE